MGMYDYVRAKCKNCGKQSNQFQSKDGPCNFKTLDYWEIAEYYGDCPECGFWNDVVLVRKRRILPDYYYVQRQALDR